MVLISLYNFILIVFVNLYVKNFGKVIDIKSISVLLPCMYNLHMCFLFFSLNLPVSSLFLKFWH
jgi:hypothetical protein